MKNTKEIILGFLLIVFYIITIFGGTFIHIYTTYLLTIKIGFFGAVISFCLPILSEIYSIFLFGFKYNYLIYIIIYIINLLIGFVIIFYTEK